MIFENKIIEFVVRFSEAEKNMIDFYQGFYYDLKESIFSIDGVFSVKLCNYSHDIIIGIEAKDATKENIIKKNIRIHLQTLLNEG